jgi:intracellular sulfur oxidation DsrE/DsrF family protein
MKRRAFVATTVAGIGSTVALANAEPAAPAPAASSLPKAPAPAGAVPFHFDRAAFEAILAKPYAHRQMITAISYGEGANVPHFLNNSMRAYADPNGFAAGPDSLHCVAVLYGPAIVMILDDAAWAKFPLGILTSKDKAKPLTATSPDLPRKNPLLADVSELVAKHDVSFFVCNNAFTGLATHIAKMVDGGTAMPSRERVVAMHAELRAHFVPGASLVPAGVATINAAQEARFTFLPSVDD